VQWRFQNDDSAGQVAPPLAGVLYLSSLNANAITAGGQWSYVSAMQASAGALLW
jgi:hypothetical protein